MEGDIILSDASDEPVVVPLETAALPFRPSNNEGDISNQIIRIGAVGERDYTVEFTTDEVFKSTDALISWARAQGKKFNMVIIIQRSDKGGGDHNRRPRIRFGCERYGQYKESKSDTSSLKSDADSRMQKRRKCGTKKCSCLFALRGVNIGSGDEWKVEVICGEHNHPLSEYLEGHSFAGRLSKKENELLADMSASLVRPKAILSQIKKMNASNVSTMKTIYNARQRHKVKEKAAKKEVKKETGLGLTFKKDDNFGEWYYEVVVNGEMIEYYNISGCYILRPSTMAIWENMQTFFDAEIKRRGVKPCYFPLFVTEDSLQKGKDHIEAFAPEESGIPLARRTHSFCNQGRSRSGGS